MKRFNWNDEKNELLKEQRGVSFEQVIYAIETGKLLDIRIHPNQERHPGQRVLYVEIERYVCVVPYVETDEEIFLKTIFPSRKATKQYLEKK